VSIESIKPGFSAEQERIFAQDGPQALRPSDWMVGDRWIDLYVLLQVPPNIPMRTLDELIIDRLADCFYASFSRRVGTPHLDAVLKHQVEFRAILLNPTHRRRYDALTARHRNGDESAPDFETFARDIIPPEPQKRGCGSALLTLLMLPLMLLSGVIKR
jgi:hypothetical protein